MKRMWWLAGLSALIALAVLGMPMTAMSLRAQAGPTMSQPLDQLSGDDFDKAFLAQMTMHHAMAVEMARPLLTKAVHPEMQALGQAITDAQTREIVQMRAWAKDWYGLELPDHLAMMAAHHQEGGAGMPGMQAGGMSAAAFKMAVHRLKHRFRQQVNFDNFAKLGKVKLSGRLRLEERGREGQAGTGWRLRPQLKASTPLIGKATVSLSVEPFFNLNNTAFQTSDGLDRVRTGLSVGVPLGKRINLDFGYLNQHTIVAGGTDRGDHVLTAGLSASF